MTSSEVYSLLQSIRSIKIANQQSQKLQIFVFSGIDRQYPSVPICLIGDAVVWYLNAAL